MGKMEKESRTKRRRANLSQMILGTVQAAGVLALTMLAPNTLAGMRKLGLIPSRRHDEHIRTARQRLVMQGLLRREGDSVTLTRRGEAALRTYEMHSYTIPVPKRWDRRWRVLIFDIPEKRRAARLRLRTILREAGLVRLQDSVWAHPYDCEDMLHLVKTELRIERNLVYIIADTIENDRLLRIRFKLPAV